MHLCKYQNKYRIPSARLSSWGYSSNAAYFITICTANREHFFGEMKLSEPGNMANHFWMGIPNHFPFVILDEFVVMPNHIPGIIVIDKPINDGVDNINRNISNGTYVETGHALSLQQSPKSNEPNKIKTQRHSRFRNQGKNTISAMVGSFKSAVTKYCNDNKFPFGWQSRFYDNIIRDNDEFIRIQNYIINNPSNWKEDKFYNPII